MTQEQYIEWLDGLSIDERLTFDRAYGKEWFACDGNKDKARSAGRRAVEKAREAKEGKK